ncbi:MAG TPA: ATP-binding protein [Rhizomicrobium sp.]|nr:ATP-binding protein [Rhizomicrobium sp.]
MKMRPAAQTGPGSSERWLPLVAAVQRLATADTIEGVIAIVRETAREISGADGMTFVMRDGERCHYIDENAITPLWKGMRFPLTACISGWCMLHGECAAITDIYSDPRIPIDAYRPTFVKSLVMTPVGHPRAVAAIGAYWAQQKTFDDHELELLEALARSTAAALATVEMRNRLREREEHLALALEAGKLGSWELDLDTQILEASEVCKACFGRSADDTITYAALLEAAHPADRARQHTAFELAKCRHDIDFEARIVWPDGSEHWLEWRGQRVPDANGNVARLAGVVHDITDRKLAKDRLDHMQAELAQLGRLNELGQMASSLAHELNQPLAAAGNYMSAAKLMIADNRLDRARELLGKADVQFTRTHAIIARVRSFVGKAGQARTPEEIGALAGEASEIAQIDPRHREIEFTLSIADGLPPVLVEKVQIQQVLLNLLRNAFEAVDGRAEPSVSATARRTEDGMIRIDVGDNGPGLAPEVAARLFEPFVTTKENGMGVGLSLCRNIIEAHGGRIWSEPSPNGGARFSFLLPAAS